jgi:TonB-dependent starch-binding outer membrane protein SusC
MKNKLQRLLLMSSKFILYGLVLQLFIMASLLANVSSAQGIQSVKEVKLDLFCEGKPILEIFKIIERETQFVFFYETRHIDKGIKLDFQSNDITVGDILLKISMNSNLKFKQINNRINVTTKDKKSKEDSNLIIVIQTRNITGKVVSQEEQEGLPGVNVIEKGTSNGTVTDVQGGYSLDVSEGATLIFSSVGYTSEEIAIGSRSVIDLIMRTDIQQLDELVVVGYGTTSKRALTGSVQKISGEDMRIANNTNVVAGLQGVASGVQITRNSGDPNSDVNIRIRGVSSVNAGGSPLIVIDGIPSGLSLNDINPRDIESIEILKDASAGAIFGSRAANGVVLISTKRGTAGTNSLVIDYQSGVSSPLKEWDVANSSELLRIMDVANWNRNPSLKAAQTKMEWPIFNLDGFSRQLAESTNTNWADIVQQNSGFSQVSLQSTGGTEATRFLLSGYYRDYSGLNAGEDFKKAQGRINLDHKFNRLLTLGGSLVGTFNQNEDGWGNYNSAYTNLLPIYPIMSPTRENKYFYDRDQTNNVGLNPYYKRDEWKSDGQSMNMFSLGYVDLKPLNFLNFRSEWSLRFSNSRNRTYNSREYRREHESFMYAQSTADPKVGVPGLIQYGRYQTYHWTTNNYFSFDKEFGIHKFGLVAGQSAESYTSDGNNAQYEGLPSDYFTLTNANTEIVSTRQSVSYEQFRFSSYFARAKYEFKKRYFAEFQFRRDGSSRFGEKNRWGNFPGASIAWLISDESFFDNINVFDFLKLRASRGFVGNAEIGNYPYLSTLVNWVAYGGHAGFLFANMGNTDIHWESQVQTNFGADFSIVKDRISGSIDYFIKDARDLIVQNQFGSFHGYNGRYVNVNLGTLRNQGFDFSIRTNNLNGHLQWFTDFNISRAKTLITKLSRDQRYIDTGKNRVVENYPLGAYFINMWAGVDPITGHELIYAVDQGASSTQRATPNDLTGEVIDGERLSAAAYNNHRVLLKDKTPYPDFYGGLENKFLFKGIDLSFLLVYQMGNWIYDEGMASLYYPSNSYTNNVSRELLNGWTAENPTNIPLLWNSMMAGRTSSRFLYDGSYVRLKNLVLGYNLPESILNKVHIRNLRIFGMGENLLTFTKYPGTDPEFFNAKNDKEANIAPGIAGITLPQVRTFSVGVSVGL